MTTISLTVSFEFSASHRLFRPDLSDDANRKLYGKCSNPNGHGHNYILEVRVSGPIDPQIGMVLDAGQVKSLVESEIIADVDHKDLNRDTPWLEGKVPTTEVVAHCMYEKLSAGLSRVSKTATLESITLHETRRISVTVSR
jgi:6-pyruvoyltetrahydropterin/6-carboxytetrahydropterin synthase